MGNKTPLNQIGVFYLLCYTHSEHVCKMSSAQVQPDAGLPPVLPGHQEHPEGPILRRLHRELRPPLGRRHPQRLLLCLQGLMRTRVKVQQGGLAQGSHHRRGHGHHVRSLNI